MFRRKRKKASRATNVWVYFISVVSCTGWGRFLWGDSCKDEFLDEEVLTWRSLVLEARWSFDAVWGGRGGYLIRLTFVEFGLLAVETLEMGGAG